MRTSQVMSVLLKLIPARNPILLKGMPGVGKSELVNQATEEVEHGLIITHPVTDEPIDVKGLPALVDGQAEFLPYGMMKQLLEADEPLVCFIDDLGQANPSVQASYMQLILARQISGHKVSDLVTFIAATNRKQDRAGVTGILEPVKSRFVTILEVEANIDDWTEWALANEVPTELIAFIMFRPNLLSDFQATSDITNTPSPRTVFNVGQLIKLKLDPIVEHECYAGAAGEGFATELMAFLKIRRDLPDPILMLNKPNSFAIPQEPSIAYAMSSALAERVGEDTMKNFTVILDRFREEQVPEYAVMAMNLAVGRVKDLRQTRAYVKWVSDNSDILI